MKTKIKSDSVLKFDKKFLKLLVGSEPNGIFFSNQEFSDDNFGKTGPVDKNIL